MIFVFYIFAALLIYLSFKSLRGGIEYLKFFQHELAKPFSGFTPFATVIVPCKGLDEGLRENLSTLLVQNYPDHEVIFVVDDPDDEAVPVIRTLSSAVKLVVAPKAKDSSQKVENLREAVLHASDSSDVFVFVDSDARPSKDWLRHLVAPLADEHIGVATGYRWFISSRPSFSSELRSVWNASIASALGPGPNNQFCWGGSTAIKREVFERLGIRDKWHGTVSDDFVLAKFVRRAGLPIIFVPQALTASIENCTFRELFEFTTRQMKLTRVYAPKLWALSFFGSGLFSSVTIAAFLAVFVGGWTTAAAVVTIFAVSLLSIAKAWLRLKAARLVLTQHRESLRKQALWQLTLWPVTQFLYFYNCSVAAMSRRMAWRGIEYELVSADKTAVRSKQ